MTDEENSATAITLINAVVEARSRYTIAITAAENARDAVKAAEKARDDAEQQLDNYLDTQTDEAVITAENLLARTLDSEVSKRATRGDPAHHAG